MTRKYLLTIFALFALVISLVLVFLGTVPVSVSAAVSLQNQQMLQQLKVTTGDPNCVFDANSVANTQKTVTIAKPLQAVSKYGLVVYNPSTVTDLTVKVFGVELLLGGGTRYAWLHSFTIPKSATVTGTAINTHENIIENYIFNGTNARFVVSNDTVLGSGQGFTAYIRLWLVL